MNSGILAPHGRERNLFIELLRNWFEEIKLNVDKLVVNTGTTAFYLFFMKNYLFNSTFCAII